MQHLRVHSSVCVCVCVPVCVPASCLDHPRPVQPKSRIPPALAHEPHPPYLHPYPQAIARPTPGTNYPLESARHRDVYLGDRFSSSAGAGGNCARPMRLPDPSPELDKNRAPMGPEILSSTGAGVWRKTPMAFPDFSSVLDKFRRRTNVQQLTCNIDLPYSFYYLFFSFVLLELKPFV